MSVNGVSLPGRLSFFSYTKEIMLFDKPLLLKAEILWLGCFQEADVEGYLFDRNFCSILRAISPHGSSTQREKMSAVHSNIGAVIMKETASPRV